MVPTDPPLSEVNPGREHPFEQARPTHTRRRTMRVNG